MVSFARRLDKGLLLIYILSNAVDLPASFIRCVIVVDGTWASYLSFALSEICCSICTLTSIYCGLVLHPSISVNS